VGDVALVPEGDVLEADERSSPDDAREPADALGDDRVPLVRHRRRALLAAAERLLHLATSVRARWRISSAKASRRRRRPRAP
jgi:hypothetical protein